MEARILGRKIFALFLGMGLLMSASFAWACSYHPGRAAYNRVHHPRQVAYNFANTAVERRFDRNRNGFIDRGEARWMNSAHVNRPRERLCDFNRSGYIDTAAERTCL